MRTIRIPSLIIAFIFFCSSVFAQNQYFTDESNTRLPDTTVISWGADISDIDNDGDMDICVATQFSWNESGPPYLLINDANGYFSNESQTRLPPTELDATNCVFGDIDWDGDSDLYICTEILDKLYINYNEGYFSDETSQRVPVFANQTNDADFADFTEGFCLDLLVQAFFHYDNGTRLFENDGLGYFTDVTVSHLPPDTAFNTFIAVFDTDNDLDLDIAETCYSPQGIGYWTRLMINQGNGYFMDADSTAVPLHISQSLNTADVDLDGDIDIIVVSGGPGVGILINDGLGYFTDETDLRMPFQGDSNLTTYTGFADFDNDGDLDMMVTSSNSRPLKYYLNDGNGYFIAGNDRLPINAQSAWKVLPFDAEGDGDADFFLACTGFGYQKLFINHSSPDTIPPNIITNTIYEEIVDSLDFYPVRISAWDNISVALGELTGRLYYRIDYSNYIELDLLPLGGTIFGQRIPGQSSGSRIDYYIEMIDRMGNSTYIPETAPDSTYTFWIEEITGRDMDELVPQKPHLSAYPNPFNFTTTITFSYMEGGDVSIGIYDITGRLIKTLTVNRKGGTIMWDATDDRGEIISSGVYFIRVRTSIGDASRKVVFLK
jgi:hypothetical protein